MEKVFILTATYGYTCFGEKDKMVSRVCFKDKLNAENYISTFKDKLVKPDGLLQIDPSTVKITVIELECQ